MRDYHLHELSGDDHELLVITICRDILGMGTINFSEGKDGGKDGKFVGTAQKYPSEKSPLVGDFHHPVEAGGRSYEKLLRSATSRRRCSSKEIPKIKKLREGGECDVYMIFTNRKLSAGAEADLVNFIKAGTGVPNVAILGVEVISSWLDDHPAVVTACGLNIFQGPLQNPSGRAEGFDHRVSHALACDRAGRRGQIFA